MPTVKPKSIRMQGLRYLRHCMIKGLSVGGLNQSCHKDRDITTHTVIKNKLSQKGAGNLGRVSFIKNKFYFKNKMDHFIC